MKNLILKKVPSYKLNSLSESMKNEHKRLNYINLFKVFFYVLLLVYLIVFNSLMNSFAIGTSIIILCLLGMAIFEFILYRKEYKNNEFIINLYDDSYLFHNSKYFSRFFTDGINEKLTIKAKYEILYMAQIFENKDEYYNPAFFDNLNSFYPFVNKDKQIKTYYFYEFLNYKTNTDIPMTFLHTYAQLIHCIRNQHNIDKNKFDEIINQYKDIFCCYYYKSDELMLDLYDLLQFTFKPTLDDDGRAIYVEDEDGISHDLMEFKYELDEAIKMKTGKSAKLEELSYKGFDLFLDIHNL